MKKIICIFILSVMLLLSVCGAWASEAQQPLPYTTFGEAVEAAGEDPVKGGTSDYMAVLVEKDGEYYRVVSMLDERAKELDAAVWGAEDFEAAMEAFNTYVNTLPVSTVEMFTAKPKTQEELDQLAGRTIGELEADGYITTSYGTAGEEELIAFWMSDGIYEYELIVDADYATYEAKNEADELGTLTVRSGKYTGICSQALNLRHHADGTIEPEEDPFASMGWLMKLDEIFQAAQNGEEVDLDGLIESLKEEFPEDAEAIEQWITVMKVLLSQGSTETVGEE